MRRTLALTILLTIVFCSPVFAETKLLIDLIGGETITSGDKLFDEFSYVPTGDMPAASLVAVTTITDTFGNFGISFSGNFVDHFSSPGGSDALIRFRVTALDENKLISDVHLAGNPHAVDDASMEVVESFLGSDPSGNGGPEVKLSIYHITAGTNPSGNERLVDSLVFDKLYRSILVQKDIAALALNDNALASLSFVDQTFSQVTIPEPTSIVFLISGVGLIACCVRRRKR
ncbi:MAG: hypothetical protein JXM70_14425 [Pirellulales bacterium]|nr:hypothetical protein [Pirellulales bacterium]